jgi:glycosyltransferase involved in cell wall biosynthesis
MIKISVVIITFNEEKNIERCLNSVKDIADEIIVVDSFSTDKTKEICLKYKVLFFEQKFLGHIEQKNFALEKANNNYVLSLDADEELSNKLISEILLIKADFQYDGYTFNRLTNYCGKWIKHCGWYPDKKLRLWDKSKGCWGGINPHDKVIMQQNSKINCLNLDILHFSFYTLEQHVDQINKFSKIKAEALFRKGKKSGIFKIILSPVFKFLQSYFIKLGFLDGFYGLVVCVNSSHAKFLTYVKLYQLNNKK